MLAALTCTLGCASGGSAYMTEVDTPQPLHAVVDMATVVFIRPSARPSDLRTTILDGGAFLGDSLPGSHFVTLVSPGQHVFIAWAESTDAVRATLEKGKVYFVEVASKRAAGALAERVQLLALTPRSAHWALVDKWLLKTKELVANVEAGQRELAAHPEDVKERLRRANDAITGYNEDELAERTLTPDDGR